jgi:beta-phosphoglucomutase
MKKLLILILTICSFGVHAMPTAVLFDCDGVLVDTEYMKYEAWQKALKAEKIDLTIKEYMALAGGSSKSIAAGIMATKHCNFDAPKVIDLKNELYKQEQIKGVEPIQAGVKYLNSLLARKDELNLIVAVVSSDNREAIIRNLKFAGVKYELLDGIFSGHDDLKHINDAEGTNKPKPYIYQLAVQKLRIDPKSTIVFEDTNAGVVAAIDAGLRVIAVPNRFTELHDFSKAILVTNFEKFTLRDLDNY